MKYIITLNGKQYEVDVEESEAALVSVTQAAAAPLQAQAAAPVQAAAPAPAPAAAQAAAGEQILAPMPGTVLSVHAKAGDAVKAGQVLLVFEAMKMENEVAAPHDGVIKQALKEKGASINTDDVLFVM